MLLKIDRFEELAKKKGYRNGYELASQIGCNELTYDILKKGNCIGSDIVAELYNRFGGEITLKVIDFEEGTLDEFKNKHVHIGKRIY